MKQAIVLALYGVGCYLLGGMIMRLVCQNQMKDQQIRMLSELFDLLKEESEETTKGES